MRYIVLPKFVSDCNEHLGNKVEDFEILEGGKFEYIVIDDWNDYRSLLIKPVYPQLFIKPNAMKKDGLFILMNIVLACMFIQILIPGTVSAQLPKLQPVAHWQAPPTEVFYQLEESTDRPGMNIRSFEIDELAPCKICEDECSKDPNCKAFTYVKPGVQGKNAMCWLKYGVPEKRADTNCITAVKLQESPLAKISKVTLARLNHNFNWPATDPQIKANTDIPGNDYRSFFLTNADYTPLRCMKACQGDPDCYAWTFVLPGVQGKEPACWLKKAGSGKSVTNDNCISGIKINPFQNIEYAEPNVNYQPPEQLLQRQHEFTTKWKSVVAAKLGEDLQLRIQLAQEEMINRQKSMMDFYSRQYHNPNVAMAGKPKLMEPLAVFGKQPFTTPWITFIKSEEEKLKTHDPSLMMLPPKIFKIQGLRKTDQPLVENEVYEGDYIIIYGKNLGFCPEGNPEVTLELVRALEVVDPSEWPKMNISLHPYSDDWSQCWFNDFIVVRIPVIKELVPGTYRATIIVKHAGWSNSLRHSVTFEARFADLSYFQMAPAYREMHLSPGAKVKLYGHGFLDEVKGKSRVELILYTRGEKEGLNEPPKLLLNIIKWEDGYIEAEMPELMAWPVDCRDTVEPADLRVVAHIQGVDRPAISRTTAYGPRMVISLISGIEFLELVRGEDPDKAEEVARKDAVGGVMTMVDHDPGCGISGEDGTDVFFGKNVLPKCVTLEGYWFWARKPDEAIDNFEFMLDKFMTAALTPWLFVGEMFLELCRVFCPGWGDHKTYLSPAPTGKNPYMGVHWENTCWFRYSGIHNIYTTSFLLRGPEGKVPGNSKFKGAGSAIQGKQ